MMFVGVHTCTHVFMHAKVHIWRSEDNLGKPALPFQLRLPGVCDRALIVCATSPAVDLCLD